MEVFYIAVLAIATATLILILTSVGVLIRKSNTDAPWPPTAGRCPDGWEETELNKCIIPDSQNNSGLITPYENNGTLIAGYTVESDKWHVCGSATKDPSNTKIIADLGSNFDYFKPSDRIKINDVEYDVLSKSTEGAGTTKKNVLTLGSALPTGLSGSFKYSGKKISVDFKDKNTCEKKEWAKKWAIKWDGVSNYNKCG
jgi:hypothetical protein